MQGEYSLPPNITLPSSAADLALQPVAPAGAATAGGAAVPGGGRWRVQVAVPTAELQEIVPAARLLQSATSLSPAEYERAKASFLQVSRAGGRGARGPLNCGGGPAVLLDSSCMRGQHAAGPAWARWHLHGLPGPACHCRECELRPTCTALLLRCSPTPRARVQAIERASISAADLNTQLRSMAQQLAPRAASAASERAQSGAGEGVRAAAAGAPPAALQLPGLQDVRGQWSGSVQAYGGGGSATSCDFDIKGQAWQWGSYGLDALVAAGSFHSEEGLQLQEVGGAGRGGLPRGSGRGWEEARQSMQSAATKLPCTSRPHTA